MRKIIIAGAGAAGLSAAIFAASRGLKVIVVEKTNQAGRKILISGGTRCNIMPVTIKLDDYTTSSSKNLLKRILKSWSIDECRGWLQDEIDIALSKELESNKYFPTSNDAKEVRDKLFDKCCELGVEIRCNEPIRYLNQTQNGWACITDKGSSYLGDNVILSTGGLSIPTMGTTGDGFRMLSKWNIEQEKTYPALTPLLGTHPSREQLSGISLNVSAKVINEKGKVIATSKRSGFLFTHKGFSGPAILDISHFFIKKDTHGNRLLINWSGDSRDYWEERLLHSKGKVVNIIATKLPIRLAQALCEECNLLVRLASELKKEERKEVLQKLVAYQLNISGNEGYKKAEVTGGGIRLEEIETTGMQLKKYPNIAVCGEILDVFGRIGGFNFYWAWLTGRLAGLRI